ncbi:MAG: WG repeat-containing protein [Bacteroidota bacterium]
MNSKLYICWQISLLALAFGVVGCAEERQQAASAPQSQQSAPSTTDEAEPPPLREIERESPDPTSAYKLPDGFLVPVAKDGHWGLVDRNGEWVVEPEFAWIDEFSGSLALARRDSSLGYIDTSGTFRTIDHNPFGLLRDEMTSSLQYSRGLAVQFDENGKCGYVNTQGEFAIPPKFDFAWPFGEDGRALVKQGQRMGVIDTKGVFLLRPILTHVAEPGRQPFAEGLEPFEMKGRWGYIDANSRLRIPATFLEAHPFSEGYAVVRTQSGYAYINTEGEIITWLDFQKARPFRNKRAAVRYNNAWGFIDGTGRMVVLPKYTAVSDYVDTLAIAAQNDQWGVIDHRGAAVLPFEHTAIERSQLPGVFRVAKDDRWGLRRLDGSYLIYPQFDTLRDFANAFAAAHKPYVGWGFINEKGLLICPMRFEAVTNFNGGAAAVQHDDKWGYIDTLGRWIITPQFESVSEAYVQPRKPSLSSK